MNRLHERYNQTIAPKLMQEFGLSNKLAAPKLVKVVVSTSFKEDEHQDDAIKKAAEWLGAITGQKPAYASSKKAIAEFGTRIGDVIGLTVTLRKERMWEFVDRFVSLTLPQVKDFQGIPAKSFDGHGNYTLGITEQIIFPEVEYDTVGKVRGLQIVFVTDCSDDTIARKLLEELGMPFEKGEHGQNK